MILKVDVLLTRTRILNRNDSVMFAHINKRKMAARLGQPFCSKRSLIVSVSGKESRF